MLELENHLGIDVDKELKICTKDQGNGERRTKHGKEITSIYGSHYLIGLPAFQLNMLIKY